VDVGGDVCCGGVCVDVCGVIVTVFGCSHLPPRLLLLLLLLLVCIGVVGDLLLLFVVLVTFDKLKLACERYVASVELLAFVLAQRFERF
jgi:hypothetical protein